MSDAIAAHPNLAATVHHSGGSYPVIAGWGILDSLGEQLVEVGVKGAAYIITDDNVMNLYGRRVQRSLQAAGVPAHCFIIPSGESSKSFELAQAIYQWLAERKAERGHTIVSVGGGVPGDLGGFVAATYLRGMPFVQVPTSMAAMVDASIGGKVAINLPAAKNLVGAFYQPKGVFADASALSTLGKRELAEGWAEAIKHGFMSGRRAGGRVRGTRRGPDGSGPRGIRRHHPAQHGHQGRGSQPGRKGDAGCSHSAELWPHHRARLGGLD